MDSTNGFLSQDFQLDEYGILMENIGEETASSDGQYQDSMNEEGILFDPTDPDESFLTYTSDTLPPGYPPFGANSVGGVHDGFLSDGSNESLLEFQMTEERANSQMQNGTRSNKSDNEDPEMFMMEAILQEKQRAHEAYSRLLAEERAASRHADEEEVEDEENRGQGSNRDSERSINGEIEHLTRRRAELMTPDEAALMRDSADLEVEQELAWSGSDSKVAGGGDTAFDHQFTPDFDQNLLDFEADDIGGSSSLLQQRPAAPSTAKVDDARTSATLTPARLMQLQERLDRAASRNYNSYKALEDEHDLEMVNPPQPLMDLGNDPIEVHDQLLRAMESSAGSAPSYGTPRVQDRRSRIHTEPPATENRQRRFHSQGRTPPRPSSTDSNHSAETVLQRGASMSSIATLPQQQQQQKHQQSYNYTPSQVTSRARSSLTQGSADGFSSCDSTDDLGSVGAAKNQLQSQSKGTLKKQLTSELATSRAKDQQIQELQSALNIMHRKYALSEVTIDQLRLGANVRLNMSYSTSDLNRGGGGGAAAAGGGNTTAFLAGTDSSTTLSRSGEIRAHSVLERPMLTSSTSASSSSTAAVLLDARSVSVPSSPMPENLRHQIAQQSANTRAVILNHEGTHMGLLMRAVAIKEQLIALAQALNDAHLTVSEQERLWGDIVAAKDQLQSEIQKAQMVHNQFIKSGVLGPDSVFDPNANLDAELFDLMCRMDQLEPRIEENVRTFKRRTPFQQVSSAPSAPAFKVEVKQPQQQQPSRNEVILPSRAQASPQQLMGHIIEAFDEIRDPELGAKLVVLEDEYLALMRRYNGIKALPATSARVSETGHLMSVLRSIAEEARGMSQVIGTREELEREFRLDAEARQLDSDLMAVQAEAEASRAGASAIRREASIGEDVAEEDIDEGHESRTSFVSTDVFGMTEDLATTSDLSSKPSVVRRNRGILREEFDSRRQLRSQGERSFSGSMDSALSTPDSFSFTRTPPLTRARTRDSIPAEAHNNRQNTAFSFKKGGASSADTLRTGYSASVLHEKPPRYQTSDPDSGFIGSDSRHSLGMRAPVASPLVEQLTPSTTGTIDITGGDAGTNTLEASRIHELEQQVNWLAEQLSNKKSVSDVDVVAEDRSFNFERYDLSSSLADSLVSSGAEDRVSRGGPRKMSRNHRGGTPLAQQQTRSRQMPSIPSMRLPNADMSSDSELEELDRAQRRRQQQSVSSAGGTTSRNSSVPRSQRRDHRSSSNSTLASGVRDPLDVEFEHVIEGLQRNKVDSFNKSELPATRRQKQQQGSVRPEMVSSGTSALPARRLRKVGRRYGSDKEDSSNSDDNLDGHAMLRVDGSTSDYEMPEFDYLEYSFKPRRRGEKGNDGHLKPADRRSRRHHQHVNSVTDSQSSRPSSCTSLADSFVDFDERAQPLHPCPTCGSRSGTPQLQQPRTQESFRYPKSGPFRAVHHLSLRRESSSPETPMREYYDQTAGMRRYLVREYSTSNLVPRTTTSNQPVAPAGPMRAYPLAAQPIVMSRQPTTPQRLRQSTMTPPVDRRSPNSSSERRRHTSMVNLSAELSGASLLRKEVTVDAALKAARSMNRLALQLQHELRSNVLAKSSPFLSASRSTLAGCGCCAAADPRSDYCVLRT